MILHHTIINQDPKQFDKDLNKFLNECPGELIGTDYTITVVPVAAPPVKIAGYNSASQPQVQFVPFFAAFITYKVVTVEEKEKLN